MIQDLWPIWLGFVLSQFTMWCFGLADLGLLVGLLVGSRFVAFKHRVDPPSAPRTLADRFNPDDQTFDPEPDEIR